MNRDIELRAVISESQSERLRQRLKSAGIDGEGAYREEQHGAILVAHIKCNPSHEKAVHQILEDLGAQTSGD